MSDDIVNELESFHKAIKANEIVGDYLLTKAIREIERLREMVPTADQMSAIRNFLELGAMSLGESHKGYFSPGGWAYNTLSTLLTQQEQT